MRHQHALYVPCQSRRLSAQGPRLETGVQVAEAALRPAAAAGRALEASVRGLQLLQRRRLRGSWRLRRLGAAHGGPCRAGSVQAPKRAAACCPPACAAGWASGSGRARQAEHGRPPGTRRRARPAASPGAARGMHRLTSDPSLALPGHGQRAQCAYLPGAVGAQGVGRYCLAAWSAAHRHEHAPDPALTWVNPGCSAPRAAAGQPPGRRPPCARRSARTRRRPAARPAARAASRRQRARRRRAAPRCRTRRSAGPPAPRRRPRWQGRSTRRTCPGRAAAGGRLCAAALVPPRALSRSSMYSRTPCMSCGLPVSRRSFASAEVLHCQPPCPWPWAVCLGRAPSSGEHPPALEMVLAFEQPLALRCHVLAGLPPPSYTLCSGPQRCQRLQTAAM